MKRLQFAILLSIPLIWFFFKLLPIYIHPSHCSIPNFIYAENLHQLKTWTFNGASLSHFDDSSNFLYVASLWVFIHFFNFSTLNAVYALAAISLLMSVYLLQRIIDSRFMGVNLLLVGLLFMSTQIWAGALGDEILFQGMLWLLAIRSFWKHRYSWLMIWTVVNIMARPDNIFILLPLIVASYSDINELKEREKGKFLRARLRKTVFIFIIPTAFYFAYRYVYFGKALPINWLHHLLPAEQQFAFFDINAFNFLKHYLRFYTLPLLIGVVFYFIKERKALKIQYFALAISLLIIPAIYTCTFAQDDNLAFKNYYPIFLGLIILSLLFIRDFRSISQGFTTAIFVFFFGIQTAFSYFEKTLQSYYNNEFYIANDLSKIYNGKAVVYYENFIQWLTEWKVIYADGRHSKDKHVLSEEEILLSSADIIFPNATFDIAVLENNYIVYNIPKNTQTYLKELKPDNSIDLFFYKYAHKKPVNKGDTFTMLIWKNSSNLEEIVKIIEAHGGKVAI